MLRVSGEGYSPYYRAVLNPNGSIKPFHCIIKGRMAQRPDGMYYLRYRATNGKRIFECVGNDLTWVMTAKLKRDHIIAGEAMGIVTVPTPSPAAPRIRSPKPSKLDMAIAHLADGDSFSGRIVIKKAYSDFIHQKSVTVGEDCAASYMYVLAGFLRTCKKTYMEEVGDEEVLAYIGAERNRGMGERTIADRLGQVGSFMKEYGFPNAIRKVLIPRYTEKIVSAYSPAELEALFVVCDEEQRFTYQFLLGTGLRDNEARYAAWSDVDFEAGTFKVTEKKDVGFGIKDKRRAVDSTSYLPAGSPEEAARTVRG